MKIKNALSKFIESAKTAAPSTEDERLFHFQDDSVKSKNGNQYDTYFGHREIEAPTPPAAKAWWQFWKP